MKPNVPRADATTWVAKNEDGAMVAVKVVDMASDHLYRWVRYFRKKFRDEGFEGTDEQLDAVIKTRMVTAPAIFAEVEKRGIWLGKPGTHTVTVPFPPPDAADTPSILTTQAFDDPLCLVWLQRVAASRPGFYAVAIKRLTSMQALPTLLVLSASAAWTTNVASGVAVHQKVLDRIASKVWKRPMAVLVEGAKVPGWGATAKPTSLPTLEKPAGNARKADKTATATPVEVIPGHRHIQLADDDGDGD